MAKNQELNHSFFLLSHTIDYIQHNLDLLCVSDVNVRQLVHDFGGLKFLAEVCSASENQEELANSARIMVFQTESLAEKYIVFLFRLKQRPLVRKLLDAVFSSETIQFVENECRTLSKQIDILKQRFSDLKSNRRLTIIVPTKNIKYKAWVEAYERGDENYETKNIKIIRKCFDLLSDSLKQCFIYLGVIPQDSIPAWKLLRLWIAEGYILGKENMEDKAQNHLNELVERNLVIAIKKDWNFKIETCSVHDLVRKFCKEEAVRQNIFRELKGLSPVNTGQDSDAIALHSEIQTYVTSVPSRESVRSFLSFPKEEGDELVVDHISAIPKIFKWLRVLDVRSVNLNSLPVEFYYMILLRYIAISCNVDVLGEKLSQLWNLQTLIIETRSPSLEIRAKLWKMKQLRHFHTNSSARLMKTCSSSLMSSLPLMKNGSKRSYRSNVQTLSYIVPECCTKGFFQTYRNLRKLGIQGKLASFFMSKNGLGFFQHLSTLEFLEDLKLLNVIDENGSGGGFPPSSFPGLVKFPSKLKSLTLSDTCFDWKYMSTIGKIENLEVLKLKNDTFLGDIWTTKDWGFNGLRTLIIQNENLVQFNASSYHFPKLKNLVLKYCYKLNDIPYDFADIVTTIS